MEVYSDSGLVLFFLIKRMNIKKILCLFVFTHLLPLYRNYLHCVVCVSVCGNQCCLLCDPLIEVAAAVHLTDSFCTQSSLLLWAQLDTHHPLLVSSVIG